MRRNVAVLALSLGLLSAGVLLRSSLVRWTNANRTAEVLFDPPTRRVESQPPVAWRNPEADRLRFFPGSQSGSNLTRILSGARVEVEGQLGRSMRPEENVLPLHQVLRDGAELGFVVTRRARGQHGGIELVLALESSGTLRGIGIQALREPAPVAQALTNEAWLHAFRDRTVKSGFRVGTDLPAVPPEAQHSAEAITECVRDVLVLFGARFVPSSAAHH